ncbi:uncharacterized protein LOC144580787 isoform X2 [Callithrix jacchus]
MTCVEWLEHMRYDKSIGENKQGAHRRKTCRVHHKSPSSHCPGPMGGVIWGATFPSGLVASSTDSGIWWDEHCCPGESRLSASALLLPHLSSEG